MTMNVVKTPVFEGPLDLLLHLIEAENLDITTVSLVQVTDQYLAALRSGESLDLRALADFVAIGAKLLLLKSRALLPRSPEEAAADDLEAEEIALDLTAQLAEYRAFKEAASYLRELDDISHRSFTRVAPPPVDWLPTGLEQVTLNKLLNAFSAALERLPPVQEPERLKRSLINIGERRAAIVSDLRRSGSLGFSQLIADCRTRLEAIVTFLAILDLLKTEEVRADQSDAFGEIVLHTAGHRLASEATA